MSEIHNLTAEEEAILDRIEEQPIYLHKAGVNAPTSPAIQAIEGRETRPTCTHETALKQLRHALVFLFGHYRMKAAESLENAATRFGPEHHHLKGMAEQAEYDARLLAKALAGQISGDEIQ